MEREYRNIGTKVSPEAYKALMKICAKKHITLYDLVQIIGDIILRYMSDEHNLTPDMEAAIMTFEHQDDWSHAFNLCDHTKDKEVTEAIYFFGDKSVNGVRAVHVKTPFFGQWTQNYNVQDILERTLCLMMPTRYKRMRRIASDKGCTSILELIDFLINTQDTEDTMREFREDFEDANRSDYGTKPSEHHYMRSMHRTVDSVNDSLDRQMTINFGEDDAALAEEEASQ